MSERSVSGARLENVKRVLETCCKLGVAATFAVGLSGCEGDGSASSPDTAHTRGAVDLFSGEPLDDSGSRGAPRTDNSTPDSRVRNLFEHNQSDIPPTRDPRVRDLFKHYDDSPGRPQPSQADDCDPVDRLSGRCGQVEPKSQDQKTPPKTGGTVALAPWCDFDYRVKSKGKTINQLVRENPPRHIDNGVHDGKYDIDDAIYMTAEHLQTGANVPLIKDETTIPSRCYTKRVPK